MSAYKRVQETINLKKADRLPINANMSLYAYHMMGLDTKEGVWGIEDPHTALKEVFNRHGGWDHLEFVGGVGGPNVFPSMGGAHFQRVKTAGIDLPADAPALVEHIEDPPLMGVEGYDELLNNGFFRYLNLRKLGYSGLLAAADASFWKSHVAKLTPILDYWKNRQVSFVASHVHQPFEVLSFMRNTRNFLTDLIRYQDKIKAILDMSIDGFIEAAKRLILNPKLNLLPDHNFVEILCLSGGGGTSKGARRMYSPRIFETLYFPYLKKMVHELHKVGYRMILHLDASWTEVLHYFKEIPKGQLAWVETDGSTD
ncbi:MAG: uroporphyrinogen decarboxylase family protein, partial [Candidatus Ranarchaeia archaeon]